MQRYDQISSVPKIEERKFFNLFVEFLNEFSKLKASLKSLEFSIGMLNIPNDILVIIRYKTNAIVPQFTVD